MATVRELVTKWDFDVNAKPLDKADEKVISLQSRLKKLSQTSIDLGKKFSTFVTLPILGLGAALVKSASDAEETESKFATVFRAVSKEAEETAKNLSTNFGLSSVKAKQLLSDTGDLLSGFGFTGEKALELSKDVNELAVDLASFTNFSGGAEGASAALTKALLGERESIKSLGITIQEKDVQDRVALLTSKGITFASERQAKAFATLQLAQEQSKNAIGDFARTNQGFANQMRILGSRVNDLAVDFGKILLPIANKIIMAVRKLIERFTGFSKNTKTTILIVAGLAAALGPLLLVFGSVAAIIPAIVSGLVILRKALLLTNIQALLIPALIIAAILAIGLIAEDIVAFFQGRKSITGLAVAKVGEMINFIKAKFMELPQFFASLVDGISHFFDGLEEKFMALPRFVKIFAAAILQPLRVLITTIRTIGGVIGAVVGGDLSAALDAVSQGFTDFFKGGLGESITASLGFGERGAESIPQALGVAASQAGPSQSAISGNRSTQLNIESPITVNVPAGTSPSEAGQFVSDGMMDGFARILRETERATRPQEAF